MTSASQFLIGSGEAATPMANDELAIPKLPIADFRCDSRTKAKMLEVL
jgi:hypothetical protein